ncbi:MAG TPA: hypothetical protein VK886_22690 [Vicinamibacterales bacterium]|nr:hypothetical protein [Vicinamibacterales bacterium]
MVRRTRSATFVLLALASSMTAAGCARAVDLKQTLQVTGVSTGWFDMGIVDGKNKLVPSITFSLQNRSDEELAVQMNIVFMLLPQKEERDDVFLQRVEIPPAAASKPTTVRSQYGFTGEQPRAEMLQHRLFQDFQVRLFVKYGSAQWVALGDFPIERRLLTR